MALSAPVLAAPMLVPGAAMATSALDFRFTSIDGGSIALNRWRGKPMLIVNTASLCGFAPQFDDLQALHETYGPRGLLVLAVSSDDFNQELADEAAVKEYCAVNFDLTLPMTGITPVTGPGAHPFYLWLAQTTGFVPKWNFNKVLIGPDGQVVATWGSTVKPRSREVMGTIDALLG